MAKKSTTTWNVDVPEFHPKQAFSEFQTSPNPEMLPMPPSKILTPEKFLDSVIIEYGPAYRQAKDVQHALVAKTTKIQKPPVYTRDDTYFKKTSKEDSFSERKPTKTQDSQFKIFKTINTIRHFVKLYNKTGKLDQYTNAFDQKTKAEKLIRDYVASAKDESTETTLEHQKEKQFAQIENILSLVEVI